MSDDAAHMADGRLIHACGAVTENDRWPRVDPVANSSDALQQLTDIYRGGAPRQTIPGLSSSNQKCASPDQPHSDFDYGHHPTDKLQKQLHTLSNRTVILPVNLISISCSFYPEG